MLKGINPLLGPDLLKILRAMGHGDEIAVVDANYPADTDAKRLVRLEGIDAPAIVDAILSVMPLDDFVEHSAFRPGIKDQPDRVEPVMTELAAMVARHEPSIALVPLQGDAFYARVKTAYALVASGERRLYGNIVLRKGVVRPD